MAERKRRVLHLLKGLGPGGAEHLLLNAARVRDREAFDYEAAYLLPWKDALVERLEAEGVRTHLLDASDPRDPRWIRRLRSLVQERRVDVVHLHSPLVAGLARPMLRTLPSRTRPAVVSTEHNVWSSHDRWTRRLNELTMPLGDRWLAVSEQVRESVPSRFRSRLEVVVHGLVIEDAEQFRGDRDAIRAELGLRADEVVAVTVANLRRQKAYPDLLRAAKRVTDAHPEVVFLAVGQGPLEDELRALHATLGLGDRFRFLGYRPDALRVAAGADIFVLASHYEGYPVAVMEAIALGLPVVATRAGAVADAVVDGDDRYLVDPGDTDRLAAMVMKLVGDSDLRKAMGARALLRAGAYDIRHAVRRTEEIYAEVARS